ncbi:MAG TPA: hypothetical protein VHU84_06150 [Lacipirellulaceae bacterium]|nr:hypothetical protein [Lacipirellulaceae bacterium]
MSLRHEYDPPKDFQTQIDQEYDGPDCTPTSDEKGHEEWTDVARVANLAEAGFIADELNGRGIRARIHQLNEFRAASDRWSSQYLIRVQSEDASKAAEHVRQYLTEDGPGNRPTLDAFRFSLRDRTGDPPSWRPIVAFVLFGVAGFVLGQRFAEESASLHASPVALPKVVEEIGRPLITEPAANQPRYRLSFDRRRQLWTVDADRDNDGIFESGQQFTAAGAAR